MPEKLSRGILFVLSAPSGAGKSTVSRKVLAKRGSMEFSISYTTRPRRAGETDGRDYHFVERERFEEMIEGNEFLILFSQTFTVDYRFISINRTHLTFPFNPTSTVRNDQPLLFTLLFFALPAFPGAVPALPF